MKPPCNEKTPFVDDVDWGSLDEMSRQLRQEALTAVEEEPEMSTLLFNTVLAPGVRTFEDAVACTITYRLLLRPCHQIPTTMNVNNNNNNNSNMPMMETGQAMFCPYSLRGIISEAMQKSDLLEAGHSMAEAVRLDALAVCERDPAVSQLLEVVLFLKGFAAMVCHRAAYYKWHTTTKSGRKSLTALWLQSQASAVFGLDIHPAATLGAGILLDHGTGVVIGETATVGDGCTLLHGVTLGGTGKDTGDRHPKVGKDVLIGANASLLGNIVIGDGAKIGAGSVVLRPIPAHATAVGSPAKIVGRAREAKPGSTMDETLQSIRPFYNTEQAPSGKGGLLRSLESTSTLDTVASVSTGGTPPDTGPERPAGKMESEEEEKEANLGQGTNSSSNEERAVSEGGNGPDTKPDAKTPATIETEKSTVVHRKASTKANEADICCPYRDYKRVAEIAPAGTITVCTLREFLEPLGCPHSQVGEILFALDKRSVGYIKPEVFFTDNTQRIIAEKTKLPVEEVARIMSEFRQKRRKERAMLLVQSTRSSLSQSAPRDIPVST